MKRAELSRPKSTDRGGGILKYVRRSPADNKTGNKVNEGNKAQWVIKPTA